MLALPFPPPICRCRWPPFTSFETACCTLRRVAPTSDASRSMLGHAVPVFELRYTVAIMIAIDVGKPHLLESAATDCSQAILAPTNRYAWSGWRSWGPLRD